MFTYQMVWCIFKNLSFIWFITRLTTHEHAHRHAALVPTTGAQLADMYSRSNTRSAAAFISVAISREILLLI